MNIATHEFLNLSGVELTVVTELMESERAKLLVEIRHTHHRAFRDEHSPPPDFGGGIGATVRVRRHTIPPTPALPFGLFV